ncbi:hypothetical protein SAMN04487907_1172 [Zunongwangia mangrovi]|uniref:Uncharacterized protein n=1 Tax=Zunongwangia mangrovi TaxID=1334022 RepID=A0A1I1N802_9FLAO|nr:hypothetical protein [Zunongwangia mangrovi]SFC93575.1 hypothetical protein SAMN04487907_1172 [Zunongwangia mangrovi]
MEIIVLPKDMSEELANDYLKNIENKNWDYIQAELKLIDPDYRIKEINIGTGADWIAILAIINALTNVFLVGDKVDKGIEGWLRIAKRIKSIFHNSDTVFMDMDSAKVYGINHIAEKTDIKSIKIEHQTSIELGNLSGMLPDRKETDFIAKPWSVYFLTYIINDNQRILLSIRSDGQIKEILNNEINPYSPF